jgi:hypothetical protein
MCVQVDLCVQIDLCLMGYVTMDVIFTIKEMLKSKLCTDMKFPNQRSGGYQDLSHRKKSKKP